MLSFDLFIFIWGFLFFCFLAFLFWNIYIFKFCALKFPFNLNERYLVLYTVNVQGWTAYIMFDTKEQKLFFNDAFFYNFRFFFNYLYFWRGYWVFQNYLLFLEDYDFVATQCVCDWSPVFTIVKTYFEETSFDSVYWVCFMLSFFIFIGIFFFYCYNPSYVADSFFFNLILVRAVILFIIVIIVGFYLYIMFGRITDTEWFYDNLYIKNLVFNFKLLNDLPKILNGFFSSFFNLFILYSIFYYLGYIKLVPYILVTFYLIYMLYTVVYFILKKVFGDSENQFFNLFFKYKLPGILLFPSGAFIVFVIYKLIWFFWFFYGSVRDGKFNLFLDYIKVIFFGGYYDLIHKWYSNRDLCETFFFKYYLTEDKTSYYHIVWPKDLYNYGLSKRSNLISYNNIIEEIN